MATPGITLLFMKTHLEVHDKMRLMKEVLAERSGKSYTDVDHERIKNRMKKNIEDYKKSVEYQNWTRSGSYP